jgi:hypothetical protein
MVVMSQKVQILEMLKEGNCTTNLIKARFGHVGATRRLRSLREDGYVIEMAPLLRNNYSYRLVSVPTKPKKPSDKAKKNVPVAAHKRASRATQKVKVIEDRIVIEPEHAPGSIAWCDERRRICQRFTWG